MNEEGQYVFPGQIQEKQGEKRSQGAQHRIRGGCFSGRNCLTAKAQVRAGAAELGPRSTRVEGVQEGAWSRERLVTMADSRRSVWGCCMLFSSSAEERSWRVCLQISLYIPNDIVSRLFKWKTQSVTSPFPLESVVLPASAMSYFNFL